ncbi:hypothetical protein F5141DRAFT_1142663 [Pisolithus sp. B1]|nr:hypothetical protein F5141DRAFT_1142663 [Pisolithus sp. B1]
MFVRQERYVDLYEPDSVFPSGVSGCCIPISWGTNITVSNNYCESGHGISLVDLVSTTSDTVNENVVVSHNNLVDIEQALRIKSSTTTQGSRVSNVVFEVQLPVTME